MLYFIMPFRTTTTASHYNTGFYKDHLVVALDVDDVYMGSPEVDPLEHRGLGALRVDAEHVNNPDAMLVEDFPSKFESGAVLGSPCGCFYYGAMGPLTDQTKLGCCASAPYLKDPALMADAAAKVREFGQIPGAKAIERG